MSVEVASRRGLSARTGESPSVSSPRALVGGKGRRAARLLTRTCMLLLARTIGRAGHLQYECVATEQVIWGPGQIGESLI